ncbi:MAG: beta-galactosidase, partial [Maribacter sp.]|nr:beta-galactosidase [Maribacter sp.]
MKKIVLWALTITIHLSGMAQWSPAGDKIKTRWAEKIDPNNVLGEYPRPIMERSDWQNMNGLWEYTIQPYGSTIPSKFDGKILVPFAVESSLSGVMKEVGAKNEVWYRTNFSIPANWNGKDVLLHFGAVDWKTDIWVNDIKIGSHTGGYTPFSFDITPFLTNGHQTVLVRVWDPTDEGPQPRGKQVKKPEGIWYTPVTGIWQTVWLEPVNDKRIENLRITPDVDHNSVHILAEVNQAAFGDIIEVTALEGKKVLASAQASVGEPLEIILNAPKLWSPESPFLYDLQVKLISKGEAIDQVASYFAMRKIGML